MAYPEPRTTDSDFPYTLSKACELLKQPEEELLQWAAILNIRVHKDFASNQLFFSQPDIETLKKAIEKDARENKPKAAKSLSPQAVSSNPSENTPPTALQKATEETLIKAQTTEALSITDLSAVVDAVSSLKERMISDFICILDDKLVGLDDLVIELVRAKSQVEGLNRQIRDLETSRTELQKELSNFKPAAFGFWKKEK